MAFLHRNENSATGSANFSSSSQCSLDGRTVISDLNHLGSEKHGVVRRRRPQQFDGVFRSDCARRTIFARAFHQMIRCRPVAMTIEQCADDPAVQNSLERFVFFLRFPLSDDLAVFQETTNMQAVRVCHPATEAHVSGRIFFLKRLGSIHVVGRFCETPCECRLMQRRLTQTPYNCLISRSRRPGIRPQRWPDIE